MMGLDDDLIYSLRYFVNIWIPCAATSKLHHLQDKDDDVQSFGFRGEVLCSIADTSLIEIITKVQGRPNGYHKVMKARTAHIIKCQYYAPMDLFIYLYFSMAFEHFIID